MPLPNDKDWLNGYKNKTPRYVVSEKAMAPHSSTLAWKIPWMEEPGGLRSMVSLRVRHNSKFAFTFHFHALEKEMATYSSVLAWRIPGTAEPDGLPSTGSHRVRHDWSDVAAAAAACVVYKRPTSNQGTHTDWKWRARKRYFMQMETKRKQE